MKDPKTDTLDRAVRVRIQSTQYDYRDSLSDKIAKLEERISQMSCDDPAENGGENPETDLYDASLCGDASTTYSLVTEGRLRSRGNLCELSYLESDGEDGLDGTRTTLVFSRIRPWIMTLTRSGALRMTLSFEEGRHHIGSYRLGALQALVSDQPALPIASYTRKIRNSILTDGSLELDYIIEVRGMDTQRTVFRLSVSDLLQVPAGIEHGDAFRLESSPTNGEDIQ